MVTKINMINQERLMQLLDYDKNTGNFFWKYINDPSKRKNSRYAGKIAGAKNCKGYIFIGLDGKRYRASHLAWLFHFGNFPILHIDHIDGNPSNNSILNLREVTRSQNQCNRGIQSNNTSGYKGVSYVSRIKKWHSYIKINRKRIHIGYFNCPAAAHFAYVVAADKFHGEFARFA